MSPRDLDDIHPADCPPFDYEECPERAAILPRQAARLLYCLRTGELDTLGSAADTRDAHLCLYRELTPAGCEYYAGHYRGEPFRCLRNYPVMLPGDPTVGAPPGQVTNLMARLSEEISASLKGLDEGNNLPEAQVSAAQKIGYILTFACHCFEWFLRIHPYANGNGHAARFLLLAILARFGHWPRKYWRLEPKPPEPYTSMIVSYR